jgi:hypothetical protein
MEKYKMVRDILMDKVIEATQDLDCVDAGELGEVVDMIKDMEEAMYYHSIVKAMENKDAETSTWVEEKVTATPTKAK